MKDYYKYCTVSQLKQQIKDTLFSAKQKLGQVSESRKRIDPSYVNKKFYTYVNQIKSKQQEYDSLINQTNEIEMLLNRRKRKINQSLEKYERNKRSKTFTSFYQPQRNIEKEKDPYYRQRSMHATYNPIINTYSKLSGETQGVQSQKGRYQTQPGSFVNINAKSMLIDKLQRRYEPTLKTEARESKDISFSTKLRSITNVVNIRIDNQTNEVGKNEKWNSFTNNKNKSDSKAFQKENQLNKIKNYERAINMSISCNQGQIKKEESIKKQKKKRVQSTLAHKVLKAIKIRIKQNQLKNEAQWQARKLQTHKTLALKHQYQTMLRTDLKVKLVSCRQIYDKIKQINNCR